MSEQPNSDPAGLTGDISGPGGPNDISGVVLDTRNAVLMDHCTVALVGRPGEPEPILSLLLGGRINHRADDRARVMFLFDEDGAAAIVTQLMAVAYRIGKPFGDAFMERVDTLLEEGGFG